MPVRHRPQRNFRYNSWWSHLAAQEHGNVDYKRDTIRSNHFWHEVLAKAAKKVLKK